MMHMGMNGYQEADFGADVGMGKGMYNQGPRNDFMQRGNGMMGGMDDGHGFQGGYGGDMNFDQRPQKGGKGARGGGGSKGGQQNGQSFDQQGMGPMGGAGGAQGMQGIAALLPAGMSERQATPPPAWADTTTIMMRNLPNKYTQRMLLTEVNQVGFLGTFDFLYLPIDPETSANRGYAFLNFIDPSFAWLFKMSYEGRKMNRFNSSKVVSVMPATLQGFDANYTHYSAARVNRGDPAARPLFLREPTQPLMKAVGNKRDKGRNNNNGNKGIAAPKQQTTIATPVMMAAGEGVPPPFVKDNGDGSRVAPKFCPHCGAPLQEHFAFCPKCGGSLANAGA